VNFIGVKKHFEILDSLKSVVSIYQPVAHKEIIAKIKSSDALLLIYPTNKREGVYTGKLFEYLGALRVVIALVNPKDVAAKLIQKVNAGYVSDNDDIENIKMILHLAYKEWQNKERREFNIQEIKKHHRCAQALKLEELILELLK
jgi:protein tyrosine phosphatase